MNLHQRLVLEKGMDASSFCINACYSFFMQVKYKMLKTILIAQQISISGIKARIMRYGTKKQVGTKMLEILAFT